MNPNAINLWVLGASFGAVVDGGHGAAIGLAISSGITFLISMFSK